MIFGRLDPYFETGTEGVRWTVADSRTPGYAGLWQLQDGDHLRVLDGSNELVWDGEIKLEYQRCLDERHGQQHIRGFWINGLQDGLDPDAWAEMFFLKLRAILTLGDNSRSVSDSKPHPYLETAAALPLRLQSIPVAEQIELYRDSLYPWLIFYSDGSTDSQAYRLGFTLEETCRLIGSPSDAQIATWRTYPKKSGDMLMPFDFDRLVRLALLQGVYAGLDWKFSAMEECAAWLNAGSPSLKNLMLDSLEAIAQTRELLLLHMMRDANPRLP